MPTVNIALPDSWDSYMQNFMGSKTRRNLRRSFRQIEGNGEFRMTYAQRDSLERDIEILLTFWQWRWGPKPIAQWRRGIIRHFFESNCLWLGVLWDKDTPVAALAALTDQQKKVFYPYIVGHDPTYAKLSPGKVMFGYSIQYAINNRFQVYDFLTGVDEYKFSFGPIQRDTTNVIIRREGLRSTVANTVLNLCRQASAQSIKILGKMKRIGIVKKIWFWSLALVKRVKR
jgi:CelD/BcsL family acetyltransferase involved in cellulose biosynthesis